MDYDQADLMRLLQTFFEQYNTSVPATVISINKVERKSTDRFVVQMMLVLNFTTMLEAHATVDVSNGVVTDLEIPGSKVVDNSGVQPAYPSLFQTSHATVPVQSSLDRLVQAHRNSS